MAIQLQAYAVSTVARDRLAAGRSWRVLAIFDQACNLINQRDEILALVTPGIGMGPFSLMLAPPSDSFHDWVTPEAPVTYQHDSGQLTVGSLIIETAGAPLWQPYPAWEQLRTVALTGSLQILRQLLVEEAPDDSLAPLVAEERPDAAEAGDVEHVDVEHVDVEHVDVEHVDVEHVDALHVIEAARPAARSVCQGVRTGEQPAFEAGAAALAGLGSGLTPSGDDFLMGIFYALWARRSPEQARELAESISAIAAPRTTLLSAAWLHAAAAGQATVAWLDLVDALCNGRKGAIQLAARAVLATGHTSGADALAGFVYGLGCLSDEAVTGPEIPDADSQLTQAGVDLQYRATL